MPVAKKAPKQFSFSKIPEDLKKKFFGPSAPMKAPSPEQSGLMPTNLDLTTVANVKDWLEIPLDDTTDDNLIQACITAAGTYWLWRTGLAPQNGEYTGSPLNSQVSVTETYNGNGSPRMFLRLIPIVSVQSLVINAVPINQSTAYGIPGWVIDGDARSIWIRYGGGTNVTVTFPYYPGLIAGNYFQKGIQNVTVEYTAGYATTPFDVEQASKQMVSENYKRRQWIGLRSQSMGMNAGSTTYNSWVVAPEVEAVITAYTRTAVV